MFQLRLEPIFQQNIFLNIFLSFWCSYLYFNAEVVDKNQDRIKLRDAVKNFWNSPMILEFRKNMNIVYEDTWQNGYISGWNKLIELLDPLGERHALKVNKFFFLYIF